MWSDPTFYVAIGIFVVCIVVPLTYTIWWGLRAGKNGTYRRAYRRCCCECACHQRCYPPVPVDAVVCRRPHEADVLTRSDDHQRDDDEHPGGPGVSQQPQRVSVQEPRKQKHGDESRDRSAGLLIHGTDPSAVDVGLLIRKLDFGAMRP